MNVQDTLVLCIRSYPTLFRTRTMALLHLFDAYDTKWVNGELVLTDPSYQEDRFQLPYPNVDEEVDAKKVERLFALRENAKAQFTRDHAALVAEDRFEGLGRDYSIRFEGRHFDDMPSDVTPDWLQAAKELAASVLIHKYVPRTEYDASYAKQRTDENAKSVAICKQFLERFKVRTVCPYERAARVRDLHREALALGMVLTEADGSSPKTSV